MDNTGASTTGQRALERTSENVRAYEGGSFRDRPKGKGLFYVIPAKALVRVAQRYEYGHLKYGQSDAFKDGLPVSDCFDSAMRHLLAYSDGDNSEDHLAAVVWNCFAMMFMEMDHPDKKWCDMKHRQGIEVTPETYLGYTQVEGRLK